MNKIYWDEQNKCLNLPVLNHAKSFAAKPVDISSGYCFVTVTDKLLDEVMDAGVYVTTINKKENTVLTTYWTPEKTAIKSTVTRYDEDMYDEEYEELNLSRIREYLRGCMIYHYSALCRDNTCLISADQLRRYKEAEATLTALRAAGVDNWSGYEYAMSMLEEAGD